MTTHISSRAGFNVSVGPFFDGCFQCSSARNLVFFFYCIFGEEVFKSLHKVSCDCIRVCIEKLSIDQFLISCKPMLKGMDRLVCAGW